jgi:hypothetical protein
LGLLVLGGYEVGSHFIKLFLNFMNAPFLWYPGDAVSSAMDEDGKTLKNLNI